VITGARELKTLFYFLLQLVGTILSSSKSRDMYKALFLSPPPWWNGGVLLVTQPSPKAISTPLPSPVLQLIRPGQAIYERSRMLMLLSSPSSASTGLGFSCQRRQRSRTITWLEDVKMATHACRKQEEGMAEHICTCY
jgi:hypothetical protein